MNPERAYKSAIKLSDGRILAGEDHLLLTMKAIDMGEEKMVAGHLNSKEEFYPIYPKDEDLIPTIDDKYDAVEFAHSCSKGQRDACERLSKGNDWFAFVVERWDSLRRLPLIAAVKRLDTGYIYFDRASHGGITLQHPDLTLVETASDTHKMAIAGFLHEDGRFLDRIQSAKVVMSITGILLNEDSMLSGEEWIPVIKDEADALDLGQKMHLKGSIIARERINVFTSLKKHLDHVELLKIALKEYERKMAIEVHSRPYKSKRRK